MQAATDLEDLQSLRQKIHESFEHRPDALMEVLDALTSNPNARSVVELSLGMRIN